MKEKYNTHIVGTHHRYFNEEEEKQILSEIKTLKPDILLVCFGMAKQEKWIYKHRDLPVKISAGVGGSIDHFAGRMKRAPKIFIKLGLEWFYRLLRYRQFERMKQLPVFLWKAIMENLSMGL